MGEHNLADYFTNHHPAAIIVKKRAYNLSPHWMPLSMHAIWYLRTREGLLDPSLSGETDDRQKNYPSSEGKKQEADGQRQTGQLVFHDIHRDNKFRMAH